VVFRTGILD